MKHYHRIKNFSISICVLSFLTVASFSIFGFQPKGIKAQYLPPQNSCTNAPSASISIIDANNVSVTITPSSTNALSTFSYNITTSADGQNIPGSVSTSPVIVNVLTNTATSVNNKLEIFVSNFTDSSCSNYSIFSQTLNYNVSIVSILGAILHQDTIRYDSGNVSFNVSNPNTGAETDLWVAVRISDSTGASHLKDVQLVSAGATSTFSLGLTDTSTTPSSSRFIVIESYRDAVIASGDSLTNAAGGGTANPLATTSGSFDVATGLGTSTGTGSTSGMSLVTGTIAKPTGASNINSTTSLVTSILNLLLYMIGILAFVSLIIGGIQYLTASGDQAKSEKGKKTLIYSVIGIILTTLALTLTHLTICALSTGQLNVACPSGGSGSYNDWGITKLLNTSDSTSLSLDSFTSIVQTLRDWALDFAGLAAFIMILYASIIYLTSYGEESKTETAKKTLMWSVIGLAVAIFSKVLLAGILDYFR